MAPRRCALSSFLLRLSLLALAFTPDALRAQGAESAGVSSILPDPTVGLVAAPLAVPPGLEVVPWPGANLAPSGPFAVGSPARSSLGLTAFDALATVVEDSTDASPGRFGRWFVRDVGGLVDGANVGAAELGLGVAGAVALLSIADVALSDVAQARYIGPAVPVLNAVNLAGSRYAFAAAALLWGGTLLTENDRVQDAAFTSVQAALYTEVATGLLKVAVGRARPYVGVGPFEFHPLSRAPEYNSFPSGHTSRAFALAMPWVVYYPRSPMTYGLLAVATGTAVARVALDKHWPSDVLAGAFVGGAIGYGLARRHRDEATGEGTETGRSGLDLPLFHLAVPL